MRAGSGRVQPRGLPDSPVQLAELRTAINAGLTDEQMLDSFVAKYGATVLAAPTTHGFDLVAWIAPFAVFAAALLGTILLVRHWSVGKKRSCAAGEHAGDGRDARTDSPGNRQRMEVIEP